MATTERTLALLGLFQSRPSWTAPELAERLGVTERTVRRDVDRLRELGYAIAADRGPAGGYRWRRGSVVPPLLLTDDEAVAVALSLRTAGLNGHVGAGQVEPALSAAIKLERLLPAAARERVRALTSVLEVADSDLPRVDAELLTALAEAAASSRRVNLGYADRAGAVTERRVEPVRLVAWRRRWYLSAFDLDRDDWRTFRLDRVREVHRTTFGFRRRPGEPDLVERLETRDPQTYRLQVRMLVDGPADALAGYAPYAEVVPVDDTRSRLVGGADDPEAAARWLLGFPHPFVLEGDEEVREALRRQRARLERALGETPSGPHD